ncbi:hypothetical protein [Paenibacillus elgii]|uniref:hypothetical protein n=1 Tax=Paenibacillus elgii TaxID=189691 RepID=UPI0013D8019D|nr:hypothetical protein [Paenibacillus elgii]
MKKIGKVLLGSVLTFSMMSGVVSAAEVNALPESAKVANAVTAVNVANDVTEEYITLKVGESIKKLLAHGIPGHSWSIDSSSTGKVDITSASGSPFDQYWKIVGKERGTVIINQYTGIYGSRHLVHKIYIHVVE